jgi:hypothetical protein
MQKLSKDDLYTLEAYAALRSDFRARVMGHKQHRKIALGEHLTLIFEDRLTMQYQVQEMLRVERIFEPRGIQEELDAYNPLIPDGSNWKATMMVEYPDVAERQDALGRLVGIENQVWVRIGDLPAVTGIADEDLDRSNEQKTSAVHFLRFELGPELVAALKGGAPLEVGVSHVEYAYAVLAPARVRESLLADLI